MTFLHMESWLIRETGVVWKGEGRAVLSPVIGVAFCFLTFGDCAVWRGNDEAE